MKKADRAIAIILLGFTAFYGFLTSRLPERDLPNTLGADFMPWLLSACLSFLAVLLLLTALLGKGRAEDPGRIDRKKALGILLLFGFFAGYVVAMKYLGYIIVTPVFLAGVMLLSGSRNWKEIILSAAGVTAAVYLLFHYLFHVPLPAADFF